MDLYVTLVNRLGNLFGLLDRIDGGIGELQRERTKEDLLFAESKIKALENDNLDTYNEALKKAVEMYITSGRVSSNEYIQKQSVYAQKFFNSSNQLIEEYIDKIGPIADYDDDEDD